MKTNLLVLKILLLVPAIIFSQKIPVAWKVKTPFSPSEIAMQDLAGNYFLISDKKQLASLNGSDGGLSWQVNFESTFGFKGVKNQFFLRKHEIVALVNQDNIILFLDARSGVEVWRTTALIKHDKYSPQSILETLYNDSLNAIPLYDGNKITMTDIRNGTIFWTYDVGKISKNYFELSYSQAFLVIRSGEAFNKIESTYVNQFTGQQQYYFPPQIKKRIQQFGTGFKMIESAVGIDVIYPDETNGISGDKRLCEIVAYDPVSLKTIWKNEFHCTICAGIFIGDRWNIYQFGTTLLVVTENITAFDISTGELLWSMEFKNSSTNQWPKKEFYWGISSITGDDKFIYLGDLKNQCIKKIEVKSGITVWETEKFGSSIIVPMMKLLEHGLLVQYGGRVFYEGQVQSGPGFGMGMMSLGGGLNLSFGFNKESHEARLKPRGDDPGISLLSISDGKKIWSTQISKKEEITNYLISHNKVFLADTKNIYAFNVANGNLDLRRVYEGYQSGKATSLEIDSISDKIYIFGDKGIHAQFLSKPKFGYDAPLGGNHGAFELGNNYFIWKDEEHTDFVWLDKKTGTVLGTYEGSEQLGDVPLNIISNDGKFIFKKTALKEITKWKLVQESNN